MHQAPGAGSGDEANRTALGDLAPRRLGPGQQDQEAEEPESLKPEEAAGAEPPKLPAHDGQDWMRALDGPRLLTGDGQCESTHSLLLLYSPIYAPNALRNRWKPPAASATSTRLSRASIRCGANQTDTSGSLFSTVMNICCAWATLVAVGIRLWKAEKYWGVVPNDVAALVGSQATYQAGGRDRSDGRPPTAGRISAPTNHPRRITILTTVACRGNAVPSAKLRLLSRTVADTTMPTQRSSTPPITGNGYAGLIRCHPRPSPR